MTIPDREDFFDVIKDLAMQLIVAALLDLKR